MVHVAGSLFERKELADFFPHVMALKSVIINIVRRAFHYDAHFDVLTDVFDSHKGNEVNEDSEGDLYLPPSCGVKHIILGHTCQFGRDRTDISFGNFACYLLLQDVRRIFTSDTHFKHTEERKRFTGHTRF